MTVYHVEATEDTPQVILDPGAGIFRIEGNSYPENTSKFYIPVLDWLKEYIATAPKKEMAFEFSFDYFNTSSSKYILEILRLIQQYKELGNEVVVKWYFLEDDTDMQETGEDYQQTIDVKFEIIAKPDEYA
jgi:hypothetical protein